MTNAIQTYDYPDVVAEFLKDIGVAEELNNTEDTVENRLGAILSALGSMFSLDVPTIGDDPIQILRQIAIDTKLANIAKERSYYRLYLMTRKTQPGPQTTVVPLWYGLTDDEGLTLLKQEDFIRFFTRKAQLGRASTFRRIKVYQRLEELGITGENAWLKVLRMPNVMQDLVKRIAVWERNRFAGADEKVALAIAERVMPEKYDELETAFNTAKDPDTIRKTYAPIIQRFVDEVENYEHARDALDHIEHDILGAPTVKYRWVKDEEVIMATVTTPIIMDREVVSEKTDEVALFIDSIDPPKALLEDMFKRIPITNRHDLPTT